MSFPGILAWMTRSSSRWFSFLFLPLSPSITPSHVSAPDFPPFCCSDCLPVSNFPSISHLTDPGLTLQFFVSPLQRNIWVTHCVSQPVPPGLPQQAVPAVVEAVSSGELVPRVPGVSPLSPDYREEGQPAQIHLKDTSAIAIIYCLLLCILPT